MRILFFSDIHLTEWPDFSYVLPNGDNSRLADLLAILGRIPELAKKHQVDAVVFAGDMFHHPRSINTHVYQKSYAALEEVLSSVPKLILIAGNHDLALFQNQQATALYPLHSLPGIEVILQPTERRFSDGTALYLLPYTEDTRQLKTALLDVRPGSILVSHCGLTEAAIGPNEIKIEAPLSLSDLAPLQLEAAMFGHYHKPQNFEGNVFIIGAPCQHTMLDRGEKRGVLIYDTKTHEAKRVWLNGPQFHLYELEPSIDDLAAFKHWVVGCKGGYVRVLLRSKAIIKDAVVDLLEAAGVKAHQVRYAIVTAATARNEALTTKLLGGGLEESLKDYVAHVTTDGLDKPRLVELGQALLKDYEVRE